MDKNIILSTERLYLKEFNIKDAIHLLALNSDPEVTEFTGDPPFQSIQDARNFIVNYDHCKRQGMGRWAVRTKSSETFIGWCGLKKNENGDIDIGFRLMRQFWGFGYATKAASGVLQYGFDNLALGRVIARVMHQNLSSIRVVEKLHMNYISDIVCDEHPAKLYELKKQKSL